MSAALQTVAAAESFLASATQEISGFAPPTVEAVPEVTMVTRVVSVESGSGDGSGDAASGDTGSGDVGSGFGSGLWSALARVSTYMNASSLVFPQASRYS